MGNLISEGKTARCISIKLMSLSMLGIGGLIGLLALTPLSTQAFAAIYEGECVGYGTTVNLAKDKLKNKCDITFNAKKGHTCQKTNSGLYRCSSNQAATTPIPTIPKPNTPPDRSEEIPPPVGTGNCRTLWAPTEAALAAANWASGSGNYTGGKDRVSFDSKTGSVRIAQPANVDWQLSDHRGTRVSGKGNVARMTVQMFLSPGFKGSGGSRFAIGVGGGVTPTSAAGNGADKANQQGWSLRVNYDADLKPMMYGYHLNRPSDFGSGPRLTKSLPTGEWVTFIIEVKLNTAGKADGTGFMKVLDKNGRVFDQTAMSNIMWRRTASWDNLNVYLTDKYKDGPKTNQYILYRNYNMSIGQGNGC